VAGVKDKAAITDNIKTNAIFRIWILSPLDHHPGRLGG
jgi:hypothetical protein